MPGLKHKGKSMKIADNILSRNVARIFNQADDGGIVVRENDQFKEKAKEIRDKIFEKHREEIEKQSKNTFKHTTFVRWIRSSGKNPNAPNHYPTMRDFAWFCEAVGKDLWEMFLEPSQIHLNKLPHEIQGLIKRIIDKATDQEFLISITTIVDMHDRMIEKHKQNMSERLRGRENSRH